MLSFIGAEVQFPAFRVKMRVADIIEDASGKDFLIEALRMKDNEATRKHLLALAEERPEDESIARVVETELKNLSLIEESFGTVRKPVQEYLERLRQLN